MIRRAMILGASGQAGSELRRSVPAGVSVVAPSRSEVDIRVRDSVDRAVRDMKPDVVFNCAAFTNVDGAEAARDDAAAANADGAEFVARACAGNGARLVHLSTDYVFDGKSHSPYGVDASPAPINTYGETKLEGERRVVSAGGDSVIVRTSWLHSAFSTNFVATAVRRLRAGGSMRVVDDKIGTPTRARHLAEALWRVAENRGVPRVLHFTDAGVASWFDVAATVAGALASAGCLGGGARVEAIASGEWQSAAKRPAFSVLDKHASWKAIGCTPGHWHDGVVASTHEILGA